MYNFKKLEQMYKSVANRRRLAIISHLKKIKEESVGMIAQHIRLSVKSTSRHLSILLGADLLEKNQRGLEVFYRLSNDVHASIKELLKII